MAASDPDIIWKVDAEDNLRAYHKRDLDNPVVWAPQPGSQTMFLTCPIFECLYTGTRGPGKAMPLTAKVLTPTGWTTMGELEVGSIVQTPSGTPSKVTHIFDHESREVYRLRFTNGETRACDEHLWKVKIGNSQDWEILDTFEILSYHNEGTSVEIPVVSRSAVLPGDSISFQRRYLEDVQYIGDMPTRCIRIDDLEHLYVTDDYIVTHNTDALLMDYLQHVGQGYGADWRGVLFRRTFPELKDVISKSQKWFPQIFPTASYNKASSTWTFAGGEQLIFGFAEKEADYWKYHGSNFSWQGWEELTTWADDVLFKRLISTVRCTNKRVPLKIRATCNPGSAGHNWVKRRYGLPTIPGTCHTNVKRTPGEPDRIAIHGMLSENQILLHADPHYIDRLRSSCTSPAEEAAWIHGSWDITSGGMFDDIWDRNVHVAVGLRAEHIPAGWRIDRSYDHGQSKPFSVGFWAQSNGEPVRLPNGRVVGQVRGDLFRFNEWYGQDGDKPNVGMRISSTAIGEGIVERIREMDLMGRVYPGVADSSIFDQWEPGKTVAGDMKAVGIRWLAADKSKGSRIQGWEQIRKMLRGAIPTKLEDGNYIRETPGLFVSDQCEHFLRTFPVLSRSKKNSDDVDTDIEDHIADEVRYRCRAKRAKRARVYKG